MAIEFEETVVDLMAARNGLVLPEAVALVNRLNEDESAALAGERALLAKAKRWAWAHTRCRLPNSAGYKVYLPLTLALATLGFVLGAIGLVAHFARDGGTGSAVTFLSLLAIGTLNLFVFMAAPAQHRYRLNWHTPLADSGFCQQMEHLVSTNPHLKLVHAINRPLYLVDFRAAQLTVEKDWQDRQEARAAAEVRAQKDAEAAACARLHSTVSIKPTNI